VIKRNEYYWIATILFSSLLTTASVYGQWPNPLRWLLVLWFLLVCPGMAFGYLLPGKDLITLSVLVIVLSLAIDAAVTQVVLYLGKWSPDLILLIIVGICFLGVLLKILSKIVRRKITIAM
jgi:hypothetical protein